MLLNAVCRIVAAVLMVAGVHRAALGGEESKLDAAAIQALIAQLNSDDFRQRAAATERLLKSGYAAIGPLTVAAKSPHAEVAQREPSLPCRTWAPSGHTPDLIGRTYGRMHLPVVGAVCRVASF